MKHLILIAGLFLSLTAVAQHTTPRYGTASTQDNTGRVLTWGTISKTDTAGATTDTVTTLLMDGSGRTFHHIDVTFTLVDSCVFALKSLTGFYYGDEATIYISNTAGTNHFVNFLGYSGQTSGWAMASTGTKISPATGGVAILDFWFNGAVWVEKSRQVH